MICPSPAHCRYHWQVTQRQASESASGSTEALQPSIVKTVISGYSFRFSQFLLVFFLISTFIESDLMFEQPQVFNIWYLLFEFTSAYANVGLSMGIPGATYSMSGGLSTASQVLLIMTMMLGKHRAMPRRNDTVVDFKYRYLRKLIAECELLQEPVEVASARSRGMFRVVALRCNLRSEWALVSCDSDVRMVLI
jgi:hypothetical protein